MTGTGVCARCGSALAAEGSPQGLCARCLLEAGLNMSHTTSDSRQETSPGPPPSSDPGPLDPAKLSRLFPQLEVLKLLGRGGMGAVYLARQKSLDRLVALKLLAPKPGLDAEFAERFGREARALARLSHPNIVAVHDFGRAEGLYYFLMEYVDGTSLRDLMRQANLRPQQALALVPQICDALQFAHDEGVVHRDIKPENILIDRKGRIKIADFGLAKLMGSASEDERLTGTHHVMGTRNYMAPEQVEHPKEVDHRADIYSLGVVFYEMLTGELPLGRFAPPSKKIHVDVRLDDVVLRALEKEPERRYQHASEIKTDISGIPPTLEKERPAHLDQPEGPFLLETKIFWLSHRQFALLSALLVSAILIRGFVSSHDWPWLLMLCVSCDGFFQFWFGYWYPPKRRTDRQNYGMGLSYLALSLVWWKVGSGTSSVVQGALIAGLCLAYIIWAGVRVLRASAGRQRTEALLGFQTFLLALCAYPAVSPLDYFSWIYRLSGSGPGPNDALVLRMLFLAIIGALLGWKIQTHRAARRIAIPGPQKEPRPKRAPSWAFFVDNNAVNPRWVWFFVGVALVFLVLVVVFSRIIG
jgi:serine/threonine protein kinase